MDIDFPLVLTWAVLLTGAVWFFDVLALRPKRRARAQALKSAEHSQADLDQVLTEPLVVEYARSFFPVFLLVLILRSFLAEPYQIPSESMVPRLQVGDFILVNKYAYGLRLPVLGTKIWSVGEPARGDIMVFIPPHDPRYFIKRVIGLPGDRIRYENKVLYINGERSKYELVREFEEEIYGRLIPIKEYAETFGDRSHLIYRYNKRDAIKEWEVPPDGYFMMGDNRGRSEDSRVWGFASEDEIVGKAVAIWLHKEPGFSWPSFSRNTWFE